MTQEMREKIGEPAASAPRRAVAGYEVGDEQPLGAYTALIGVFSTLFALFLLAAKVTGRPLPQRIKLGDLALLGVSTHKLSWILANSSVTSPLRAPVTELKEAESPTKLDEEPRGEGLQRALGNLLTCQFCLGMWAAAFFSYGLVLIPRTTRFLAGILATLTLSDFLHQTYKTVLNRAE